MGRLKVGLTLPQFGEDPEACIEVARQAEAAGLDGVFVFDHLWAIGRPDRPAPTCGGGGWGRWGRWSSWRHRAARGWAGRMLR